MSLKDLKGFGAIIATCDANRGKEAAKELVNLLNQTIEQLNPTPASDVSDSGIQDALKKELDLLKKQTKKSAQAVQSIHTGAKGLVLVRINDKKVCPVALVKAIFDRVRGEKLPCSRYLVRVIPLQKVCYPNTAELRLNIRNVIHEQYPDQRVPAVPVIETVPITKTNGKEDTQIKASGAKVVEAVEEAKGSDATETVGDSADDVCDTIKNCSPPAVAGQDITDVSSAADVCATEGDEPSSKKPKVSTEKSDEVVAVSTTDEAATITEADTGLFSQGLFSANHTRTTLATISSTACAPVDQGDAVGVSAAVGVDDTISSTPGGSISCTTAVPAVVPVTGTYTLIFKRRNHNVLQNSDAQTECFSYMPSGIRGTYKSPQDALIVDILQNICGVSYFSQYCDYADFNLRKFQQSYVAPAETSTKKE